MKGLGILKRITLILMVLFVYPSFGADVLPAPATCDNETLKSDGDPVSLRAEWTANTFTLNYYDGDEQLDIDDPEMTRCTYDDKIAALPDGPEKPGYAFRGWRVRPRFDMTTLSAAEPSGDRMFKGFIYGDNQQFCDVNKEETTCDDPRLADLSNGEWSVSFGADGTIKGEARCSTTAGNSNGLWNNGYNVLPGNIQPNVSDDLNQEGAKYCWCRASGHAESGSNNYQPVASPAWVFRDDFSNADLCTDSCADYVHDDSAFRRAVFGVTQ